MPVIECAPYSREAGYRAAGTLLDGPSRPTAFRAASDELALGALRAAAERGIEAVLDEAGTDVDAFASRHRKTRHEITDQWREW